MTLDTGHVAVLGGMTNYDCAAYDSAISRSNGYGGTGTDPHRHVSSCVEVYDPHANTWSSKAPMSAGRAGFCAQLLADGKLLVAGGYSGMCPLLEQSCVTAGMWHRDAWLQTTTEEPDNQGDHRHALCWSRLLNTAELYDPVFNTWESLPPMPQARASASSCLLGDGRVALFGGWVHGSRRIEAEPTGSIESQKMRTAPQATPSVVAYDFARSKWVQLPAMPTVRVRTSAVRIRGGVLLTGGVMPYAEHFGTDWDDRNPAPPAVSSSAYMFDEISEDWYELPHSMGKPRIEHWSISSSAFSERNNMASAIEQLELATATPPVFSLSMPTAICSWRLWVSEEPTNDRWLPYNVVRLRDTDSDTAGQQYDGRSYKLLADVRMSANSTMAVIQDFLRGPAETLCLQGPFCQSTHYAGKYASAWRQFLSHPKRKVTGNHNVQTDYGWSADINCNKCGKTFTVTIRKNRLLHDRAMQEHERAVAELAAARVRHSEIDIAWASTNH